MELAHDRYTALYAWSKLLTWTDTSDATTVQLNPFNNLGALEHDNSTPSVQTKTKIIMQHAGGIMFLISMRLHGEGSGLSKL